MHPTVAHDADAKRCEEKKKKKKQDEWRQRLEENRTRNHRGRNHPIAVPPVLAESAGGERGEKTAERRGERRARGEKREEEKEEKGMTPDLSLLSGFARGVLLSLHVRDTCLHSGSWLLSGFLALAFSWLLAPLNDLGLWLRLRLGSSNFGRGLCRDLPGLELLLRLAVCNPPEASVACKSRAQSHAIT